MVADEDTRSAAQVLLFQEAAIDRGGLKEVKVGFIGSGGIASAHAQRLSKLEGVKVAACYDVDESRASSFSASYGAVSHTDLGKMLKTENIDAVYVCTPPFARGIEMQAIEMGVPTFLEKPVALTMERAQEIASVLKKHGVVHSVGYMWRYLDVTDRAIEELRQSGPVGMVMGQYIDPFWFPRTHWWLYKDKGGGQVVEQSTHVFDLIRLLVGDVTRVAAEIDNLIVAKEVEHMTSEDFSIVVMRFKSGAMGVVCSSCASQNTFSGTVVRIIAKQSALEHVGHAKTLRIFKRDHTEEIRSQMDALLEEDKVFVEAVRTGDTSKIRSSFEDAMKTLEVTIAANKAAEGKAVVSL